MTYSEVYNISVPPAKRAEEAKNYFISKFVRPFSIIFTMLLAPLNIHPIAITKISIGCLLIGAAAFACDESMSGQILGWLMFFAWGVLDCVDGNLARYNNMCSPMGELWDTVGGYSALILLNLSAGIGAFYGINRYDFCEKYYLLIFAGIAAIASIFPRLVTQKKKNLIPDSTSANALLDKSNYDFCKSLMLNVISPLGFMQPLLLLAILVHMLNFYVCFYAAANIAVMLAALRNLLAEEYVQ